MNGKAWPITAIRIKDGHRMSRRRPKDWLQSAYPYRSFITMMAPMRISVTTLEAMIGRLPISTP